MKKTRASRQGGGVVYRPVASGWQSWVADDAGGFRLHAETPELEGLKPAPGGLVAVPVRRAFSLCVWVPADDPSLFPELLHTQLELRGLAARTRDATTLTWDTLASEGGSALLHATVLPPHLAPKYWSGEISDYAVSPLCLPLQADAISVWQEEGGWVTAVTRGEKLLHFQPLAERAPGEAMAMEIWLMLAPLEAGGMFVGTPRVELFYEGATAPDLSAWQGRLPVQAAPLPPPRRPPESLRSVPLPVRELQHAKQVSARRQKIVLAAAAVYLALVLALAGTMASLAWRERKLRADLARDSAPVQEIKDTMNRWDSLGPAIDPTSYPLEVLYQAARLLPKDGVRLTLFTINLDRVVVAGEASTLQAAQKFQESVRDNPELAAYDWALDNPKPLPTGSAKFQINGVRRGSPAAKEGNEGANS